MEYLHRRGKVRQYQNFREIVNSPEVLSAIEDLTKTVMNILEDNEFKAQKDVIPINFNLN